MGIGLRTCLLVIAAVVLGLSVTLARHQAIGQVPAQTGFGTFAGAAGFFASVFGMAALWFDHIDEKILMGLDAVVSILYLAGAISLTVALQNVSSCTAMDDESQYDRYFNQILNGGCIHTEKGPLCPHAVNADGKDITPGRCQTAQADYVFEYVGFVFGMVMVCLGYFLNCRGRGGTPTSTRL
ncbi:marvel domain-containing protein [Xylaria cf. heliscus]|nr:marvel domain-containing protein [Xylaria cf. heliscus]